MCCGVDMVRLASWHIVTKPDRGNDSAAAACRIVWLAVLEIHDPLAAFIFEEVTGIWPDFMLLITSWYMFATTKHSDLRARIVYFNWGLGASW